MSAALQGKLISVGIDIAVRVVPVATQTKPCAGKAAALQQNGVIEYVNNKQGYRIERPSTWEQTSKAGADVLFTDPLRKSTTIGVTVNPIKIAGLEQFGDVKTVREKLVNTEKQKVCALHTSQCNSFFKAALAVFLQTWNGTAGKHQRHLLDK